MEKAVQLLIADDDALDRQLLKEAFKKAGADMVLDFVVDGEELMEYLAHKPMPTLLLLDLNMPRKTGKEALRDIRSDSKLKVLPTVILSTSNADFDVRESYELGANWFLVKPSSFNELIAMCETLCSWVKIGQFPN